MEMKSCLLGILRSSSQGREKRGQFFLVPLGGFGRHAEWKEMSAPATSVHSFAVWVVRGIVLTTHAAVAGTFWAMTGSKVVCDFNS